MKYLLTTLLGFLLGVAMALTALYFNPFTQRRGPGPIDADTIYSYASPITSGLAFTHGGLSRLPTNPSGIPELWEATINKTALSLLALDGADGRPAALASRFSFPAEASNLLSNGALLHDEWLISVPGEGSMFVTAISNWWPFLEKSVIPVWYLGRPAPGPTVYTPTIGPGPDGRGIVRGATGSFARRRGSAGERYQIEVFDDRVGPRQAYTEFYWLFDDDEVADNAAD